ncbi:MAG TPA: amino acid permease [Gemmatimonadales bacterium]|nr:amino acid permease [Gemmatimonadales bacterium]
MTQPTAGTQDRWGDRLPRRLGFWSAVAVLVGSTIGSGIFRTPAGVASNVPDVPVFLLAWILGAVVALCGALTYAELAAAFPRTGGLYVFLREGFGPLAGFLFGWGELVIIRPGAYGAISITSSAYAIRVLHSLGLTALDPASPVITVGSVTIAAEQALAAGLIVVVAAVNWFGIHRGAILQNLSTALKVLALATLVGLGFLLGGSHAVPGMLSQHAPVGLSPFLVAMVAILWAYDGWADLAFVSGEVRDPQRNLPRAIILGTAGVVVLYLGAIFVYLHLIPMSQMGGAQLVAADAAQILLGPAGVVFVGAAVAVSTFGTLNGSMMTAPRIFFALGEDGLFPRWIARVSEKNGAPTGAILLAAFLGAAFVLVRTFAALADQFVIGIWPFYAMGVAAVFVLRRSRPDLERPYRTWGYPVVPALFLLGSVFLLGNYLVSQPRAFALDVGLILLGIPAYYLWLWIKRRFLTALPA